MSVCTGGGIATPELGWVGRDHPAVVEQRRLPLAGPGRDARRSSVSRKSRPRRASGGQWSSRNASSSCAERLRRRSVPRQAHGTSVLGAGKKNGGMRPSVAGRRASRARPRRSSMVHGLSDVASVSGRHPRAAAPRRPAPSRPGRRCRRARSDASQHATAATFVGCEAIEARPPSGFM